VVLDPARKNDCIRRCMDEGRRNGNGRADNHGSGALKPSPRKGPLGR
jgi:hypothetical protein